MSEVQKILRIEPQDVGCKVMKLIDINEAEQALYDLLMEKAESLHVYNHQQNIEAIPVSAINELFGRTE